MNWLNKLLRNERGEALVEYGLIAALIVIAVLAAIINLADTTVNMWHDVANKVIAASS